MNQSSLSGMIRNNKKLFYRFFDYARVSQFLGDESAVMHATTIMSIIKENSCTDLLALSDEKLAAIGFDNPTILEFREYERTGNISRISQCLNQLEEWVLNVVLPNFFDLDELRFVFESCSIKSQNDLCRFYNSQYAIKRYGMENSKLFSFFVQQSSYKDFPLDYSERHSSLVVEVSGAHILGNFHNHTRYSDGRADITQLAALARKNGRKYIGISDHTKRVGGVDESSIEKQHHEIDSLNEDGDIIIFKSVECEILKDGSLDLEQGCLSACDYVIAAVHSDIIMTQSDSMRRVICAIENPYTNILAHPSGRLYKKKPGLFLDMYKVIDACIANRVVIEINGSPERIDLDPQYVRYAVEKGTFFSLDSDTHAIEDFYNINNSIRVAEDCQIPTEQIINTFNETELMQFWKLK